MSDWSQFRGVAYIAPSYRAENIIPSVEIVLALLSADPDEDDDENDPLDVI